MPISYQYTPTGTDKAATLDTVDRELCERTDSPYDKKYVCPVMDVISWTGIAILSWASRTDYKSGAYVCDRQMVLDYLDCHPTEETDPKMVPLLLEYLCGRYTFSCWR